MKIALYHGYELTGSGSNEYTRYLALNLARQGHEVVLICGEPDPESHAFISTAWSHDQDAEPRRLFSRANHLAAAVTLHRLPRTAVHPVYVTDRQRAGNVKAFPDLTDAELDDYHAVLARAVARVLASERPQVLHANHLVYQPVIAAEVCGQLGIPFYVVPHGSSIEYTVKRDARFLHAARRALQAAQGIAWIGREVRERVMRLFPDLRAEIESKSHPVGVGTDTELFRPIARRRRRAALDRLKPLHRSGGKTPAQRRALEEALARGEVAATRSYWDAYDHRLADSDLPALLDRLPVDDDLIGYVGSLTYGKGVQTLIAAMPAILARRPRTHLVVVGSGTFREVLEGLLYSLRTGDEPLFDELVRRGQDLERGPAIGPLEDLQAYASRPEHRRLLFEHGAGLGDHVHFLGRLDHARLCHVLPTWRLAAFPSIVKEASPLVFAESLASGVLPIGAYHSGLRDGLDDLRAELPAAVWARMGIATAPAERVQGVVDSGSELPRALAAHDLAGDLRRIAEERYDWRAIAAAMVGVAGAAGRRPSVPAPR